MISLEQREIGQCTSTTFGLLAGRRYSLSSFLLLYTSFVAHSVVCIPWHNRCTGPLKLTFFVQKSGYNGGLLAMVLGSLCMSLYTSSWLYSTHLEMAVMFGNFDEKLSVFQCLIIF